MIISQLDYNLCCHAK